MFFAAALGLLDNHPKNGAHSSLLYPLFSDAMCNAESFILVTSWHLGWVLQLEMTRLGSVLHQQSVCSYFCQPWAFESREFLRALAVGKEITFISSHSLPSNDDVPRDIGSAEIGGADLSDELLKNGWAKLKDLKRDPTEEDTRKRDLENEAKASGKGLWNPHGPTVRLL